MAPNLALLSYGHTSGVGLIVMPLILLVIIAAVLGKRPWLACLLLLPFALLAPLDLYYITRYHAATTPAIIASIFATNLREAREYLGGTLLPLVMAEAAVAVLTLGASWLVWRARWRWTHRSRTLILALAIGMPVLAMALAAGIGNKGTRMQRSIAALGALSDPFRNAFPVAPIVQYATYRQELESVRQDMAAMDAFRFHARRATAIPQRQIYVLVIGEASRRDHWQLLGYGRATNPELSKLPQLVPITDMLGSWPQSITAIPQLLTRRPPDGNPLTFNEPSILRAMDEAGFDTWWISNQMPLGLFDSMVATYALEARHSVYVNHVSWTAPGAYDEAVLHPFRDAIASSHRDLFIVLHLMGSHQRYDYRYPAAFRRFQPTETDTASSASIVDKERNSYDNSILYTDHVLAEVIGILQKSGAVTALWYESDHGESLPTPTCPLIGHGNGTREEYEVSAFAWVSNAYMTAFPHRVAALRENAGKRTLSADTFESLIDMANLTYPGRDASHSLFDPDWQYRPRIVNYPVKINMDNAVFDPNCQIVEPPSG
ncbi:MAG: lipid A phosphoethanolamine transferase [Proteobacteria bacterium]|nr:lipid A phosphoethanolamine transferase [Pseudomonadota bacterium]